MGNLTENRINAILTDANISEIKHNVEGILAQLPDGSLTDDERSSFKSIDVNNKIFVEDTLNEIGISGAGIIPAFLNPEYIKNDFTLFEQLDAVESSITNVLRRVSDLKRIAGSEAYDYSLTVYRIYESANLAGIPGAKESYEKLKARFDAQGSGTGRPAVG
jgi:hypothetical protein